MRFEVDRLCQGYGNQDVLVDISFSAISGEVVSLLGPNGSGKSTLIKTMCNLMTPKSGKILADDNVISEMELYDISKIISYVPQFCSSAPYMRVIDVVLMGRKPYMDWSYSEEDVDIAIDAIKIMGIEELSCRNVSELSGGQFQRVNLARAIAQSPYFFIFDEPTSSLDLKYQMEMMNSMRKIIEIKKSGMIMAMHDLNLALNYSDKVVMLKDKCIYDIGKPEDVINPDSIRDVYGVESSIVENDHGLYILPFIPGQQRGKKSTN